jgi:hypothetical protein
MGVHSTRVWTFNGSGAFVVLALAVLAGPEGCQCHDVCPPPYGPFQYCTANGTCTVAGAPITHCADDGTTPNCILWNPPPGETLTLPVGAMWPTLGTRDDLAVDCNCTFTSQGDAARDGSECNGAVTVQFDGVPATGCSCLPGRPMMCSDIPHSVKVISLTFSEGAPGLALEFHDNECEGAHRICER